MSEPPYADNDACNNAAPGALRNPNEQASTITTDSNDQSFPIYYFYCYPLPRPRLTSTRPLLYHNTRAFKNLRRDTLDMHSYIPNTSTRQDPDYRLFGLLFVIRDNVHLPDWLMLSRSGMDNHH